LFSDPPAPVDDLVDGEVHVWWTRLEQHRHDIDDFIEILSPDERMRAGGYHFDRDRMRFIVRRALLRIILARYLGLSPGKLQFDYGPCGKPEIHCVVGLPLSFNLSHADGFAVFAVTAEGTLGVDVERIRPLQDIPAIAKRFLPAEEANSISHLTGHAQLEYFLRCWTRKEALAKATGQGIAEALDSDRHLQHAGAWSFRTFTPAPGYVGTLATGVA